MGIQSLHFKNFRVFRDATLRLGATTLLIGPNGTGKTTCMDALALLPAMFTHPGPSAREWRSIGVPQSEPVGISVEWAEPRLVAAFELKENAAPSLQEHPQRLVDANNAPADAATRILRIRVFSFVHGQIASPVPLTNTLEIRSDGWGIPAVLTTLQDQYPERFESLNKDLANWLPEFDRILLETTGKSNRAFMLRVKDGQYKLRAHTLSQGTLLAVALLALCHLPDPPEVIGLEEPDRGMHPRLLRDMLDAIHRLSHPENFGDNRKPVQVIMTTHSPYFIDFFRDHLEDVVIVEKRGLCSTLKSLSDIPYVEDIVRESHLGEAWFRGDLGGVPVHT
jgi:predicted ATPase